MEDMGDDQEDQEMREEGLGGDIEENLEWRPADMIFLQQFSVNDVDSE